MTETFGYYLAKTTVEKRIFLAQTPDSVFLNTGDGMSKRDKDEVDAVTAALIMAFVELARCLCEDVKGGDGKEGKGGIFRRFLDYAAKSTYSKHA